MEIIYHDNDTTSGKILTYYNSAKPYQEVTLQNNKYVGVKKTFFENGQISQIDSLSEPCDTAIESCDGIVVRYNENGTLSQRYQVKNHAHNGITWQYRNDGSLAKQYEIIDDTIKNGYYIEFYPNGKVANKMTFKNDTVVGMSFHFVQTGDTVKYCNHYNGYEDFPYKIWFDKNHSLMGIYTNENMKTVTWIWYENTREIKRKIVKVTNKGVMVPDN
ncbi:MAG: phosphatidylinositol-4-phosphate 5-kinase [Segetibacter sp.]|nr:phosphatidylinositol-4-phosphate 5-kinase [Segetibacter sp.]